MDNKQFLFEVSWEVCNKVGGIYTVIHSKLEEVKEHFGERYCLIGPAFDHNPEFTEDEREESREIAYHLTSAGIPALVGQWKDKGVRVILVKYKEILDQESLLYALWEDYRVDSMSGKWDYIEPVLFSTMAARVIEELSYFYKDYQILAHFHEWLSGGGLLYLNKNAPEVATVFTTHATVLGRSMAGNGVDIFSILQNLNPEEESRRFNVLAKHSLEKASAQNADCFTTVSEITSIETKYILGADPEVVLPNGFNIQNIPSYQSNRDYYQKNRAKLLDFASRFLGKSLNPENTFIISTSGRYEYHNKGLDLLIETLGEMFKHPDEFQKNIIFYMFIIGGFVDMSREKGQKEITPEGNLPRYSNISTHPLWDPYHDPIANGLHKKGIMNNPGDNLNVIYVPVFLNGQDGVLNMEYYDALAGCDLTLYPSYYEPWGYTPLESGAYSIPTVSTDVAGFGKWILTNRLAGQGIRIIRRYGVNLNDSLRELKNFTLSVVNSSQETLNDLRISARKIAQNASWKILYKQYLKAYDTALEERGQRLAGKGKREAGRDREVFFPGSVSTQPRLRDLSTKSMLPRQLEKLQEIAYNLWWTWDEDAFELFRSLQPDLFEQLDHNPIHLFEVIDPKILQEAQENPQFMERYNQLFQKFSDYLAADKPQLHNPHFISDKRPIAYFTMEFGLHESLKIFSGGLGILSGDFIKSASDLNIPLVGVSLFYKQGYFKQRISREGFQVAEYITNDCFRLPLRELTRKSGEKVITSIYLPGRSLFVRVWTTQVGKVTIYLLDTDLETNSRSDRQITARLYESNRKLRLKQEILLGMGGAKLLEEELKIYPALYHINEGHSAFLLLQRLIHLIKQHNMDFECAKELVKSSTVFTTHTPVPAGNERFDMPMIEHYFEHYINASNIHLNLGEFYEMGRIQPASADPYDMTVLALRNSHKRNGVSRLHGHTSRKMWSELWKGYLSEEVPILSITNGVHVESWMAGQIKNLIANHTSLDWTTGLLNNKALEELNKIPANELWYVHVNLKKELFRFIEENIARQWEREGESPYLLESLKKSIKPEPLTIGFARRFAEYKRATLILDDMDRIKKILLNTRYPVQLVFAGKAHPENKAAHQLIQDIVYWSKEKTMLGKIFFIEDYGMLTAKRLVSGVDLWLNNPRRPLEASGTSGQKAGLNGVINFSVLDGWWDEGYNGQNGWVIGNRKEYPNTEIQDLQDSKSLYEVLENEIIPCYYDRDEEGIPRRWTQIMKNSMLSVLRDFSTHRMMKEYLDKLYEPTARKFSAFSEKGFQKARDTVEWKKSVRGRFPTLSIKGLALEGVEGGRISINEEIKVHLELDRGKMEIPELKVEMLVVQNIERERGDASNGFDQENPEINRFPLELVEEQGTLLKFETSYKSNQQGKLSYGVRVLPYHPEVDDIIDLDLVYWA
ncbi:alpha-glucan family phosphorylase [bacterium]|nr:alpha-glucan family phosphorylase [bacterium]